MEMWINNNWIRYWKFSLMINVYNFNDELIF